MNEPHELYKNHGNPRALEGRRIVITRAPEQAEDFVRRLMELGAEVLPLPMVRFADAQDAAPMDLAITHLNEFDWVIFTSANAVRFFLKRCRTLGLPFETDLTAAQMDTLVDTHVDTHVNATAPTRPLIAVVGPATRDALEIQGLSATVVAAQSSGAGLIGDLVGQIAGKRVLLPRSDIATGELPAGLRATGAAVTEVAAYRTLPQEAPDSAASFDHFVITTLRNGDADVITFFSPSAFHHFANAMGDDALRAISARVAFAALGPVTAAAIREAGIRVACEGTAATTDSLVTALAQHFTLPVPASSSPEVPASSETTPSAEPALKKERPS